jgi:hypothetical protein
MVRENSRTIFITFHFNLLTFALIPHNPNYSTPAIRVIFTIIHSISTNRPHLESTRSNRPDNIIVILNRTCHSNKEVDTIHP